jgi:hypothetical protein
MINRCEYCDAVGKDEHVEYCPVWKDACILKLTADLEVETAMVLALKKELSHAREYITMKKEQNHD